MQEILFGLGYGFVFVVALLDDGGGVDFVAFGDFENDVHAVDDASKHGVNVARVDVKIEVGSWQMGDKELGPAGIFSAVCHAEGSAEVPAGFGSVALALNCVAGSAGSDSGCVGTIFGMRTTGLNDEHWQDAMKQSPL